MIDLRVPILTSSWSGTGTVVVFPAWIRCIRMWLPRRQTSTNPCNARIRQTSRPDITRSLPNCDLNLSYKHILLESPVDLVGRRAFKKQFEGFAKIFAGLLNRISLAGDIEFRAEGDECAVFRQNDGGQPL